MILFDIYKSNETNLLQFIKYAKDTKWETKYLINLAVKHTGQSEDRIKLDMERDFYMFGEAAKEYGAVDKILLKI